MPNVQISFNTKRPNGLLRSRAIGSEAGRWLLEALQAAISGKNQSDGLMWSAADTETLGAVSYIGQALAALSIDEGTMEGEVGGAIAGDTVTVDADDEAYDGDAVLVATALAAEINASTAINRVVTATNLEMRLTLATVLAGTVIRVCGIDFTAQAGAPTLHGRFNISGNDAADALSLATAINRHPALALRYRAWSNSAVVHIVRTTALGLDTGNIAAGLQSEGLFLPAAASTVTLDLPKITATNYVTVLAAVPGLIGNEVRMAASGTGVAAVTNGTTGLLGLGTGGGTVPYLVVP